MRTGGLGDHGEIHVGRQGGAELVAGLGLAVGIDAGASPP